MPTLDWIGKNAVAEHHQEVPFRLLREDGDLSVGDPANENLLIQGDNLHALKALLPYYAGQVKCIYIDPPYNTGNEGWTYNDNVNSPEIREWLNNTVGKEAEDLSRHDKWLCMMYPRLVLLHKLLANDGSFWMSIDDNEVHHARALLNEVFGGNNFVAEIAWQRAYSPRMDAKGFSKDHDYLLVFRKSEKHVVGQVSFEQNIKQFSNIDASTGRRYRPRSLMKKGKNSMRKDRPNLYFPITAPDGSEIYPIRRDGKDGTWRWSKNKYEKRKEKYIAWENKDGKWKVHVKQFLERESTRPPSTFWLHTDAGHNHEASQELKEILGANAFPSPKPTRLIRQILEISTEPGDIVLDSFAGSGTTGQAVLELNSENEVNRRFILVEIEQEVAQSVTHPRLQRVIEGYDYKGTERTELYKQKLGIRELKKADQLLAETDHLKKQHASDYDGFERRSEDGYLILRGKKKIQGRKEGLGGGFRFFELGPDVFSADGRIREDVTFEELARHVFFVQTGQPVPRTTSLDSPLIGEAGGTAVYLLFNGVLKDVDPAGGNVLTRKLLSGLPSHDGPKAIYGTACKLSKEQLQEHNILFRQIPYEVRIS